MLIDAVMMCDEPAVAHELATTVGCPPSTGNTAVMVPQKRKLAPQVLMPRGNIS